MDSAIVSFGAGLYWASMVGRPFMWGSEGASGGFGAVFPAVLALAALGVAPFLTKRGLKFISMGTLAFNIAALVFTAVPGLSESSALVGAFSSLVLRLSSPLLMLMWGVQFASVSRRQAFSEVILTVLISAAAFAGLVVVTAQFELARACFGVIDASMETLSSLLLVFAYRARPV